jgi:hypothetical protein
LVEENSIPSFHHLRKTNFLASFNTVVAFNMNLVRKNFAPLFVVCLSILLKNFASVDAFTIQAPSGVNIRSASRAATSARTRYILSAQSTDGEIEQRIGLSREDHENRNQLNELPKGKLTPSAEDPTIWKDDKGRPWKLNAEPNAAYHQPMPLAVAFIRAYLGRVIPQLKVPNLKFISPNADGRYSEVCANRYTGELVIDQKIMGTFNFATDAPDAMKDGKLPITGEHDTLDIVPHNEYGGKYRHIARGMMIGSISEGPVILGLLEEQ